MRITAEDFAYAPGEGVLIRLRHKRSDWLGIVPARTNRVSFYNKHYRIINLRECTRSQNQYNKVSPNPHGLKGVTWRNRRVKPWLSKIRVNGIRINLGSFATKEEAGEAYQKACIKYHGEFACLEVK